MVKKKGDPLDQLLDEAQALRDSTERLHRIMAEQARRIDERRSDKLLRELERRPGFVKH